jgi:hypothetical protein
MTIEMVTRYGEAVDLSAFFEPIPERALPHRILVQRLGMPTQRFLRQPPELGALGVLGLLGRRRHGVQCAQWLPVRRAPT